MKNGQKQGRLKIEYDCEIIKELWSLQYSTHKISKDPRLSHLSQKTVWNYLNKYILPEVKQEKSIIFEKNLLSLQRIAEKSLESFEKSKGEITKTKIKGKPSKDNSSKDKTDKAYEVEKETRQSQGFKPYLDAAMESIKEINKMLGHYPKEIVKPVTTKSFEEMADELGMDREQYQEPEDDEDDDL